MLDQIRQSFLEGLKGSGTDNQQRGRRIGAELKFPLVNGDGTAASREKTAALWEYLAGRGWAPVVDGTTGKVIGAEKPGPQNATVASCETGYCKPEFSLAHVPDLHALEQSIDAVRRELAEFCEREEVFFLGYGIQPSTPPSSRLLMNSRGRTSVWDKLFGANRCLSPSEGDDVCLFTINAAAHTHLSVGPEEAVRAVNVLNGFAGAQIALTADSCVWQGRIDPRYKCVGEKFWDWWMPDAVRIGVPPEPFEDLRHYLDRVVALRPVFVKRQKRLLLLPGYRSFRDYVQTERAVAVDAQTGEQLQIEPMASDFEVHSTCYWYNGRLSRYYTVENRVNDQQPPAELLCVHALSLGLVEVLKEAWEVLQNYDWDDLRECRSVACEHGLQGRVDGISLAHLAEQMLEVAALGLSRRHLGEERFLAPLEERLQRKMCPADEAAKLVSNQGIRGLVAERRI